MAFKPNEEPSVVPVWVAFPGLPANLFQESFLRSIAGNLGPALKVALSTSEITKAYACIELDVLKPRSERIWIGTGDGGAWQHVEYVKVPKLGTFCNGHDLQVCNRVNPGKTLVKKADEIRVPPVPTKPQQQPQQSRTHRNPNPNLTWAQKKPNENPRPPTAGGKASTSKTFAVLGNMEDELVSDMMAKQTGYESAKRHLREFHEDHVQPEGNDAVNVESAIVLHGDHQTI